MFQASTAIRTVLDNADGSIVAQCYGHNAAELYSFPQPTVSFDWLGWVEELRAALLISLRLFSGSRNHQRLITVVPERTQPAGLLTFPVRRRAFLHVAAVRKRFSRPGSSETHVVKKI